MKPVKADSMKFCSPVALEAKEIEQEEIPNICKLYPKQHKKRLLGELLDATDVWAQHKSVSWYWASGGRYAKTKKITWSLLGLGEGQKCPQIVIKIAP